MFWYRQKIRSFFLIFDFHHRFAGKVAFGNCSAAFASETSLHSSGIFVSAGEQPKETDNKETKMNKTNALINKVSKMITSILKVAAVIVVVSLVGSAGGQ